MAELPCHLLSMTGYLNDWRVLPPPQFAMLLVLAIAVVLANISQPYPHIAPLQHVPTILMIAAAPVLLGRWPLSNKAMGALLVFMLLHTLGGRYTYSNVPYDTWWQALTGHTISEMFGLTRNGYDRFVHLAFGLLWVLPLAEAARRYAAMAWRAGLAVAFLFVGAMSAVYEVLEWLLSVIAAPDVADSYNGQQGDMWDAQKDMALAMIGAAIAAVWHGRKGDLGGTA